MIEGLKAKSEKGVHKALLQHKLIENVDYVFVVGQRLVEIRDENAYEIIPGLAEMALNTTKNHRTIMIYGRFDGNIALVKQSDLACAVFGH